MITLNILLLYQNMYNDVYLSYVSFALADLERIGVPSADLQKPDALLSEAVLVYVQANFGGSVDEKLMQSYNMILIIIH